MISKLWLKSDEWFYTKCVMSMTTVIIVSIVFIMEFIDYIRKYVIKRLKIDNILHITKVITLLFYLFSILTTFYTMITLYNISHNCRYDMTATIMSPLSKLFLYQLFICRLYIIYSYQGLKNKYIIIFLKIFGVMVFMFPIILSILFGVYDSQTFNYVYTSNGKRLPNCVNKIPKFILPMYITGDFIISTVSLYLFVKPILYAIKLTQNNITKELYHFMVRVSTLSIVCIITTLIILLVIQIFGGFALVQIDRIFNTICVVLMNKNYTGTYNRMCKPCSVFIQYFFMVICCLKALYPMETFKYIESTDVTPKNGTKTNDDKSPNGSDKSQTMKEETAISLAIPSNTVNALNKDNKNTELNNIDNNGRIIGYRGKPEPKKLSKKESHKMVVQNTDNIQTILEYKTNTFEYESDNDIELTIMDVKDDDDIISSTNTTAKSSIIYDLDNVIATQLDKLDTIKNIALIFGGKDRIKSLSKHFKTILRNKKNCLLFALSNIPTKKATVLLNKVGLLKPFIYKSGKMKISNVVGHDRELKPIHIHAYL